MKIKEHVPSFYPILRKMSKCSIIELDYTISHSKADWNFLLGYKGGTKLKKDRTLSTRELDYIVSELQQAQRETSSTIALQPARSIKLPRVKTSIKMGLIGILLGIILSLAAWLTWHTYSERANSLQSDSVVESIQKLATLATAQEHVKTILSQQDNKLFGKTISINLPGTKRTLFLVVPGVVTAGVDLKDLKPKAISLDNKTKTISITLPHATIVQDPSLDLKNIKAYSSEGIFRSQVNWTEGFQLADTAKQQIKQEAIDSGLLTTAEDNARLALQDFFSNLGYKVKVTFK